MKKGEKVLIVGLGVMGGSYAIALTKKGYVVLAVDTNPAAIEYALENNIISEGTSGNSAGLIRQADYVVLAMYPNGIVPWLKANKEFLKKGALITDLAGVKTCFLIEAQKLLANDFEFIASHPMAGCEKSGVQNADAAIFSDANFLVTPTLRNTKRGVAFAKKLANELGFARVTEISPCEHDEMVAYVSQLTHAIAVSLVNANDSPMLPAVTGDSFRDLTRIAKINENLWSELFLSNRELLVKEIDVFTNKLGELRQALCDNNKKSLKEMFRQSTNRRAEFDKK